MQIAQFSKCVTWLEIKQHELLKNLEVTWQEKLDLLEMQLQQSAKALIALKTFHENEMQQQLDQLEHDVQHNY